MGGSTGFQLAAFDLERDAPTESDWTSGPADAVLIVDGVFLQRPELRDLWTFTVWLDVPDELGVLRSGERDGTDLDPASEFNRRYLGAQELYRTEADPVGGADAVIELREPDAPQRR
jgi:uridine kinase